MMATQGRVVSYEDLQVWRMAMEIGVQVYQVSASFPAGERFGLTSQVRRAAVSIPSNIPEGHARTSTRDFMRFLSISMGSIAEVETQLKLACRLDMLPHPVVVPILGRLDELNRMLRALRTSLSKRSN